jgi:hypothetical protein
MVFLPWYPLDLRYCKLLVDPERTISHFSYLSTKNFVFITLSERTPQLAASITMRTIRTNASFPAISIFILVEM